MHARLLQALGGDRGQGYHFARPMTATEVSAQGAQQLSDIQAG
jgi:EAL domain-containing protein (putative c-di-GMP-specific phosphodiesterase class I)